MEVNYLHIWPRNQFMMIALPNQGGTFTVTLFMPFDEFEGITAKGDDGVIEFFENYYPDSIEVLGVEGLKETFNNSKPLPLVTVKVRIIQVLVLSLENYMVNVVHWTLYLVFLVVSGRHIWSRLPRSYSGRTPDRNWQNNFVTNSHFRNTRKVQILNVTPQVINTFLVWLWNMMGVGIFFHILAFPAV